MKLTPPAPQNIRRRELFFLEHADKYPTKRVHAELLRIAMHRANNNIRWGKPDTRTVTREERLKETASTFQVVEKKQGVLDHVKNIFKPKANKASQRGN